MAYSVAPLPHQSETVLRTQYLQTIAFSRLDRTSRTPNVEADTLRFVIRELAVSGYRSVRKIRLPLQQVNVLTGPNGCGKSNLYNAMFLLARVADGSFGQVIAQEGGMPS